MYLFCLKIGRRESNKQKHYRGKNLARSEETETEALSRKNPNALKVSGCYRFHNTAHLAFKAPENVAGPFKTN